MKYVYLLILFILQFTQLHAQKAKLSGVVYEANSRIAIPDVMIQVEGLDVYDMTDEEGNWTIELAPGLYNLLFSHLSYTNYVEYEVRASNVRPNNLTTNLEQSLLDMAEISVTASRNLTVTDNTNSIQLLDIDEIQRLPGATMDISKVLKSLPGVVPKVSFGYNIIARGGGSFENKFYLDGISIPVITHFNVQGLSGGPNGIINTDLIQSARFNTGAFPANRGNALSSVLEMEQKLGRSDRLGGKFTLGASEYGMHFEGPAGKKSSYIISGRKSYTEYLLKAFNVPVLPSFIDYQYKHQFQITENDVLNLMILGSRDQYVLNTEAESSEALQYNIGYIPEGNQATNVVGLRYKHFTDKGVYSFIISHDRLSNDATKYRYNSGEDQDLSLQYQSKDINTRLRFENKLFSGNGSFDYGFNYDYSHFVLDQYSVSADAQFNIDTVDFVSDFKFQQFGFFASYNNSIGNKFKYSVGARLDGNTYNTDMENPLNQFSPRIGLSYQIAERWLASIQSGIYYQIPPSILMANQNEGKLTNQENLKYIRSNQISGGLKFQMDPGRSISLDGFYKKYSQYPFLLQDSISFANASGEYVAVGNQLADSSNEGVAYGVEFFYQQKLSKNWFGNVSSSYVVSKFQDKDGKLVSSAWDSRFFFNIIAGRRLKNNWTIGARWTYSGANPYTPYDVATSSDRIFWDANQKGTLDFSLLNTEHLPAFHQLDFRVDKKWFLKKATILLFLDLQNLYNNKFELLPYLTVQRNEDSTPIVDPTDDTKYLTNLIQSDTGRLLPTIGFSIEF